MEEVWLDVCGYEGRYQVSNRGNVRSLRMMKLGKILVKKPEVHYSGYLYHKLWAIGHKTRRKIFVHRIVAEAFLLNPEGKGMINHLDRNRQNNDLSNLEWATASENVRHWIDDDKKKLSASSELNLDPTIPF